MKLSTKYKPENSSWAPYKKIESGRARRAAKKFLFNMKKGVDGVEPPPQRKSLLRNWL